MFIYPPGDLQVTSPVNRKEKTGQNQRMHRPVEGFIA